MLFRTTLIMGSSRRAIGVELSQFLENILSATKMEMDRGEMYISIEKVQKIMKDVSFEKAYKLLPLYCFHIMNTPRKQQEQLGEKMKMFYAQPMTDHQKTTLLGIALIEIVGERLLKQAVKNLGDAIRS